MINIMHIAKHSIRMFLNLRNSKLTFSYSYVERVCIATIWLVIFKGLKFCGLGS